MLQKDLALMHEKERNGREREASGPEGRRERDEKKVPGIKEKGRAGKRKEVSNSEKERKKTGIRERNR